MAVLQRLGCCISPGRRCWCHEDRREQQDKESWLKKGKTETMLFIGTLKEFATKTHNQILGHGALEPQIGGCRANRLVVLTPVEMESCHLWAARVFARSVCAKTNTVHYQ